MRNLAVIIGLVIALAGCNDARVASHNLSKASDQFEVDRRVVFYNGITGAYLLEIVGKCSIQAYDSAKVAIVCKTGKSEYKKHYLGLSDNVTYFAEQLEGFGASAYRYRVIFKPEVIIPDIDLVTSLSNTEEVE